jgi:hypothetical protein
MSAAAVNDVHKKRRRIAIGMAVALAALSISFAPAPAHASGSFSVKVSAWGCTEGDDKGSSYSYNVSGGYFAYAQTSYQYPICMSQVTSIPGARPIAGSTMGPWAYGGGTSVTTRIQKANSNQAAYGNHSLGNGSYLRNS